MGFIYAAASDLGYEQVLEECWDKLDTYEPLENVEAFWKSMPEGVMTGGLKDWRGFIRRETAGWVDARDVMMDVYADAKQWGASFVCGESKGRVSRLLYSAAGDVVGALTADGNEHRAGVTILAAGAPTSLLLDFEKQLRPTTQTLGHVALTSDEVGSGA
jgi:glycine/D-amino acid oxidase-like deaminating enzyme